MKRKTTFAKSIMLTVFSVCIVTALCMSTAFAAESDATLDIADRERSRRRSQGSG